MYNKWNIYLQSILDSTYYRECRLVERGFPGDIANNEISKIIGRFKLGRKWRLSYSNGFSFSFSKIPSANLFLYVELLLIM